MEFLGTMNHVLKFPRCSAFHDDHTFVGDRLVMINDRVIPRVAILLAGSQNMGKDVGKRVKHTTKHVRLRGGGCAASKPSDDKPLSDLRGMPSAPSQTQLALAGNDAVVKDQPNVLPKSKWDEMDASSLKKALLDTDMIDAAYLADLANSKAILPRCQDVPASAKVSLAEMEAWGEQYTVGVLIISYPWLDK